MALLYVFYLRELDFVSMYDGVDAVTDLPAAFWYQELSEAFPEAKVILTIRDSEDVWLKSWVKSCTTTWIKNLTDVEFWLNC